MNKTLDKLTQIVDQIEFSAKEALRKEGITEIYGLWTLACFAEIADYIRSNYDDNDIGERAYREVQNQGVAFFNDVMGYMLDLDGAPDMSIDGIKMLLSDYFDSIDNA